MSVPTLRFDQVACLRGGRLLFEGLSFALGAGDAGLVTGPNGAGKSSLLRIAAALLAPVAGTVTCTGRVSLSDENLALDPALALADALRFWARLDGSDEDAIVHALDALAIAHLARIPVRMLSTGQRKRASLARVLASRAPIWLLDEPGNGLDTAALERLAAIMADHRASGGIILAASHQPLGLTDALAIPVDAVAAV